MSSSLLREIPMTSHSPVSRRRAAMLPPHMPPTPAISATFFFFILVSPFSPNLDSFPAMRSPPSIRARPWSSLERPPEMMRDLADHAAAEGQHAGHEDHP